MDAVILAVSHREYTDLTMERIGALYADHGRAKVLADIKGMLDRQSYEQAGYLQRLSAKLMELIALHQNESTGMKP